MDALYFRYQVTEAEYLLVFRRLTKSWKSFLFSAWYMGLLVAVILMALSYSIPMSITFGVATIPLAYLVYSFRQGKAVKRTLRENAWMLEEGELCLSAAGVNRKLRYTESTFQWPAFKGGYETPEGFALILGGGSFLILPYRVLASGDLAKVRALLQEHMKLYRAGSV